MIKNILFKPNPTDPVFWAYKEIYKLKIELYEMKTKFARTISGSSERDFINLAMHHNRNKMWNLRRLIYIAMTGKTIDNHEARPT